jgi:hypothetical protein
MYAASRRVRAVANLEVTFVTGCWAWSCAISQSRDAQRDAPRCRVGPPCIALGPCTPPTLRCTHMLILCRCAGEDMGNLERCMSTRP